MINELAMQYDVHPSSIYRALPDEERRRRLDRGEEKIRLPAEVMQKMLHLAVVKELPAPEVLEFAVLSGWIEPGQISVPTWNRYLANRRMSKAQRERRIAPFRRFEESTSNERHSLDITQFPDYFVTADRSIGFESRLSVSKNRLGNSKPRLWLFMMIDGHSRTHFGMLYRGKNMLNWLDFMIRAWSAKQHVHEFPFQGRPDDLYSDNEGIFRAPQIKRFLEAMEVRYHAHAPGVSRAKGKVERPIGVVQQYLRHAFSLMQKPTLEKANDYLYDLLFKINHQRHRTTGQAPMDRWRAGFNAERRIRLMPERSVLDRYFYTEVQRQIGGDVTVQLDGRKWQLPRSKPFIDYTGETVSIFHHSGDAEDRSIYVVINDVEYEVPLVAAEADIAGQFRSSGTTKHDRLLEELAGVDVSDVQVGGFREMYAERAFLPAQGEELDLDGLDMPRRALSRLQLVERLQDEGVVAVPPSKADSAYIDALYADDGQVYEDDLSRIIDDLGGAQSWRAAAAS